MLVANAFGLPTVERAYPTLVGALAGYTEGGCATGSDFVCNVKDGLYTCRPCNFPQLSAFKQVQDLLNRLATAFEFGRDKLSELDGRIGGVTARLVGLVGGRLTATLPPPQSVAIVVAAAKADPTAHDTFRQVASAVPELITWLSSGAAMLNAPTSYPTPPALPRAGSTGDGPVTLPSPTPTPASLPPPRTKAKAAGMFVGVLGVLTAIGLVATAHYSKKGRRIH